MESFIEKRIEVQTIFGKLTATISEDKKYPEIYIYIEEGINNKTNKKQLALIHSIPSSSDENKYILQLLIYADNDSDNHKFILQEKNLSRKNKDILWERYLNYICKWANSHNHSEFYGMTPAGFDEWIDCEYDID